MEAELAFYLYNYCHQAAGALFKSCLPRNVLARAKEAPGGFQGTSCPEVGQCSSAALVAVL